MAGVNKAIIVGRLGKDPEIRYTQDGQAVANFTVATSEQWRDKNTGEKRERTEWHRIVAWGRTAEICGEYLAKGKQIYIEGRIQTREWEDKDGIRRYTTEIVVSQMQMLGSPSDSPSRGSYPDQRPAYQDQRPAYQRPAHQDRPAYPDQRPDYRDQRPAYQDQRPAYQDQPPPAYDSQPSPKDTQPDWNGQAPSEPPPGPSPQDDDDIPF